VVDQQHLRAAEFRYADNHVAQVVGFALAQTRARLVHHHKPRLGDDAARDLDEPPLARVEYRTDALSLAAQTDIVQPFRDESAPGAAAGRQIVERGGDVIPDGEIFDHLLGLERSAHAEGRTPVHGDAQKIDTVDNDRAGCAFDEPAHGIEQ